VKVAAAMVLAWTLRTLYLFSLADRVEAWAGIDYDPDDDFWGA